MKSQPVTLSTAILGAIALTACTSKPAVPKTAQGAAESVLQGLQKDDVGSLWRALPASYQAQLNTWVHTGASKMDAELYDKGVGVLGRTVKILDSKRKLVLGNSKIKALMASSEIGAGEVEKAYGSTVSLLGTLLGSELKTLEGLKKLDVGKFAGGTASKLMKDLRAVAAGAEDNPFEKLATYKIETVSSEEGIETLKMTTGDDVEEEKFVQVEGKWIPMGLKEAMDKAAQEASSFENMELKPAQKAQALMMLGMAESMLEQLEKAKTQEEFDGVLASLPFMK